MDERLHGQCCLCARKLSRQAGHQGSRALAAKARHDPCSMPILLHFRLQTDMVLKYPKYAIPPRVPMFERQRAMATHARSLMGSTRGDWRTATQGWAHLKRCTSHRISCRIHLGVYSSVAYVLLSQSSFSVAGVVATHASQQTPTIASTRGWVRCEPLEACATQIGFSILLSPPLSSAK